MIDTPSTPSSSAPHIVYRASAGTGKTYQLSSRYIRLLALGADPSTILATTFTRKAAGEILERILKRLSDAAACDKALKELRESIGLDLSHDRCEGLVADLARNFHRLNIGTIDSFFARTLHGFALDLAAPPCWSIIDDEPDRDLRSLAVTRAIESADSQDGIARLRALVRMLHKAGFGRGVHSRILKCVADWYGAALSSLDRPETWEAFGPPDPPPTASEVALLADAVGAIQPPTNKDGEQPNKTWVNALDKLARTIRAGAWEDLSAQTLFVAVAGGGERFSRISIPARARATILQVVSAARNALLKLLLDRNTAARDLLADFDREYTTLKHRVGVLRFDDVPRVILASGVHGRLEDLYYRLDARIHHLLLDEFQDTSLDQFEVLMPLIDELASNGDGSRTVFCVGDVKQSLYSWRGGEPKLLPAIPRRWPQFVERTLSTNRRSSPQVLDAVNAVFQNIAANAALAESPSGAEWAGLFARHEAHQQDLPGHARLIVAPDIAADDDEAADAPARRIATIVDRAAELAREAPRASIAILTRTNKLIPRLIFALRERGLAAIGEHGNPLTDSPAAAAAISALHLADHPGDSAALFHMAVTPFGPFLGLTWSCDEKVAHLRGRQVAARLRTRIARDGIPDFLRWCQRRLAPAMDAFGHARFDQLVDLADGSPGLSPSDFARLARQKPVEPPPHDGDPVRVMTIHKAKGLEFDAVILPELDGAWKARPDAVLADRRDENGERDPLCPITAVTTWPSEPYQAVSPELRDLCQVHLQRQYVEELCLLYVAMTRARRRLEMIVFPPPTNGTIPTAQRVLCAALAPNRPLSPGETLWESRTTQPWHQELRRVEPPKVAETLEVRLAPPSDVPAGRLASKSPSALEGGDHVHLADLWGPSVSIDKPDPRERGTAFHTMFESIMWLDEATPDAAALTELLVGEGTSGPLAAMWTAELLNSLRGDIAALLSRDRYSRPADELTVRREWSFIIREHDRQGEGEHLLTGQIDRVVIGHVGGRPAWAEVIDFKTDDIAATDSAALANSVEHYRPQLEAYKRAVSTLLRVPPGAVSACLAFTGPGRVVTI